MEVTASIETPQVFAGEPIQICVEFKPTANNHDPLPILLSGYALVQGSFRLGDMILAEPFLAARKSGVVLSKRGLEYGQPINTGGLFFGVLDGLKNLVVNPPSNPSRSTKAPSSSRTHDEDNDYPIFATSQLLLFTDLKLNSPQQFHIVAELPPHLPPTYRSRSLQISYQFVVGFERLDPRLNSKPVDTKLFLNFRLLPKAPTIADPEPVKFDLTHPINTPSPQFIHNGAGTNNMSEFIDNLLDEAANTGDVTNRRRSSSVHYIPGSQYTKVCYDISRNGILIAQLLLAKPAITVGDVLAAQLKFSRPCMHVSVYLELEETIEEPYAALPANSLAAAIGNDTHSTTHTIFARQFQGCYGLQEVPLYLPTLTSIAPRLDTEQITAKWSLRIEFVGLIGSAFGDDDDNGRLLAKSQVDHEMFTCRIPIYVLPVTNGGSGHSATKTWKL